MGQHGPAIFVVVARLPLLVRVTVGGPRFVGLVVVGIVVLFRVDAIVTPVLIMVAAYIVDRLLRSRPPSAIFHSCFHPSQRQLTAVWRCKESPGLNLPGFGPMGMSRFPWGLPYGLSSS